MPVVIDKELYNLVKQHADEVYQRDQLGLLLF